MDRADVLAEFNNQMRRNPAPEPGCRVERDERVTRIVSDGDGWNAVLWTDLADADAGAYADADADADADAGAYAGAVIDAQIRRFAEVAEPWEWKYYSYDRPAQLPSLLQAAGFVADPAETVLVARIADLNLDMRPPAGVKLIPVTDAHGAAAVVRVHDEVFGGEHAATGAAILAALESQPRSVEAVVAVAGDTPVSSARVEFHRDSDFASLWGGGTLPSWRRRGVFRSLVAYRAQLAMERGYRYLHVDASPDSRPIFQRLGFTELAVTIPFRYPGY